MEAKDSLLAFFKSTEKALKHYSVAELNSALTEVLKEKTPKSDQINYVLDLVAVEYGISRRTLLISNSRGEVQTAKKMAQCLLHFVVGLNTRFIAKKIFNRWQNSVTRGINYYKTLDLAIPQDKTFFDKYNSLEQKINEKFN